MASVADVPFATYDGVRCAQAPDVFRAFAELFSTRTFDLIIELGTGSGGFTRFLRDAKPHNCNLVTFNKTPCAVPGVDCRVRDVFSSECFDEISGLVAGSMAALILCDNGNKIQEVQTYSAILRPDDVIMAHDYCADRQTFRDKMLGKVWNWCEIVEADVQDCRISPLLPGIFGPVAWGCWRFQHYTYAVNILSNPVSTRTGCGSVIAGDLASAWRRLFPDALVANTHNTKPKANVDATVIHLCLDSKAYNDDFDRIREQSTTVLGLMEIPPTNKPDCLSRMDGFYYFGNRLPESDLNSRVTRHVAPPINRPQYSIARPRSGKPRRILLDHTPWVFGVERGRLTHDWTDGIWATLSVGNWSVGQLGRNDEGTHPAFVKVIPLCDFEHYLQAMNEYDTFVVTHAGSFNHSAKDAACLGLKVIVPERGGRLFVPRSLVERLHMTVVHDEKELLESLQTDITERPMLGECADFAEIATLMDRDIRARLQHAHRT